MVMSLVSVFALGLAIAAFIFATFKTLRRKPPKYLIPVAAGGGMLVFGIYNEYSWFYRYSADLPDSIEVVETFSVSKVWQPWTYVVPRINSFLALDHDKTRRHEKYPQYRSVHAFQVSRDKPDMPVYLALLDCDKARLIPLANDVALDAEGLPVGVQWNSVQEADKLFAAACRK